MRILRILAPVAMAPLSLALPVQGDGGPGETQNEAPNRQSTGPARPWQANLQITPFVQANLATGNLYCWFPTSRFFNEGLQPAHRIDFFYNSEAASKGGEYTGGFQLGAGWSTTVGSRLEFPASDTAVLTRADGTEVTFAQQAGGAWAAEDYWFLELEPSGTDWVVRERNQYEYHYDAVGALTTVRAPSGNEYEIEYAAGVVQDSHEKVGAGNLQGRGATYTYDPAGRLEVIADNAGHAWTFDYDASGMLSEIVDPIYGTLAFEYDGQGRLKDLTDYDGHTWSFQYRTGKWENRLRAVWNPDRDRSYLFNYDDEVTTVTTRVTDLRGNVWRYRHDVAPSPALERTESPLGHAQLFDYDARKLLASYTDALGHVWDFSYGANGLLREITDPEGKGTLYGYDALNSLDRITVAGNVTEIFHEDPDLPTAPTRVEEPTVGVNGATTLIEHFDLLDGTLPGEWNGLPSKVTDAEGVETVFEFTGHAILDITTEGPYGAPGAVVVQRGSVPSFLQGSTMSYPSTFPALPPAPSQIQGPLAWNSTDGTTWTWRGAREDLRIDLEVPIDSGDGWETSTFARSYAYDHLGRLVGLDETTDEMLEHVSSPPPVAPTRSWSITYDDLAPDSRAELTTPDGDVIVTLRDADGRVTQVFTNSGGTGEISTNYTYYANGLLQSEARGNGTSTHYTYYDNQVVASIEHREGTSVRLRLDYSAYDARNLPTLLVETTPTDTVSRTFAYDDRMRLVSESRTLTSSGVTTSTAFTYDAVGNRTSCTKSVAGTIVKASTYHYDSEDPAMYQSDNNRLMWVETNDGQGEHVETTWFFYDNPYGNVSNIVRQAASSTYHSATAFRYTAHGTPWLMWDESWDDLGSGPVNVSRGPIHETRQVDPVSYLWRTRSSTSLAPQAGAEWSSNLDLVAARFHVDDGTGATTAIDCLSPRLGRRSASDTTQYAFDSLGGMRLSWTSGGTVQAETGAFGEDLSGNSAQLGFSGAYLARHGFGGNALSANDINHLGYRFYGAEWGRFLLRDSVGIADGPNVYSFVQNIPTILVDRDGRQGEVDLSWMWKLPGFQDETPSVREKGLERMREIHRKTGGGSRGIYINGGYLPRLPPFPTQDHSYPEVGPPTPPEPQHGPAPRTQGPPVPALLHPPS